MTDPIRFGVIGGSGVYQMDAHTQVEEISVDTPFGAPSDSYTVVTMHGQRVAFLARHGRGHLISPSRINYRANIYGFKLLGVEYLIALSACGSLQEHIHPGDIVIPDQLFDRTRGRALSFFDDPTVGTGGLVVHVGVADPFCALLSDYCHRAAQATGNPVHKGSAFVTIEGPRFSTKAESRIFRSFGLDIIGMTTTPEAQLAREAEMSYAVMAHVTDYDVWHETEEVVTVDAVVRTLTRNAEIVKQAVANAVAELAQAGPSPYADSLRDTILSDKKRVDPAVVARLAPLVGKYFT